jgi:stearoyl-CoA desaturase (delta-9 desaturase)
MTTVGLETSVGSTGKLFNPWKEMPFQWNVFGWIVFVHLMGFVGAFYLILIDFNVKTVVLAFSLYCVYLISITAGAHRLYAHPTYKATWILEAVLLVLFTGTFQGPTIWWASYHIAHHAYSDTKDDPYTVHHGFFWAHIGWLFFVPLTIHKLGYHLNENDLIRWQYRYYIPLAILMALLVPAALGWVWGDPLGGILVGGFLRLLIQYHATWCNNSVSHSYGSFAYKKHRSARKNWIVAVMNFGEGYHERHHWVERDYRLGPHWYDLDPGKWFIWTCAKLRLARDLQRVPESLVLARIERSEPRPALI